ncbi:hypothetical protein DFH08DRAFT_799684 [Mycena albidolilacea]|uniref:Nephrocystin 3-like N-terminal domain-containing protein n=1 Tax=Mycena albidolilacea TaxID=1033008 RepID=A0AAD7AM16_9AGAR|nr:hypothetical protein DFH08DRAFT_799684 [Mycena albidolilacea]
MANSLVIDSRWNWVEHRVVVVEQVKDPRSISVTAMSLSQIPTQLVCSSMAGKNLKLMNQFKELQSIKEKLASNITTQHKFTDQSKSLCAPGTHVELQEDILKWLSPQLVTKEQTFWITGIAGSGKSTLSATLVNNLGKKDTPVAAQFFISRNIAETIDPAKISSTIAE